MVRFTAGCLAIDPTGLGVGELRRLLEFIKDEGLTEINVLIRSSQIYATNLERSVKDLFVIPQGSFIICGVEPSIPLGKLYLLDKDVWLDVKRVDLGIYLHLFDTALNVSTNCLNAVEEIGGSIYRFECTDTPCGEPVVLDYLNLPLFWVSVRKSPLDKFYQDLLVKVLKPTEEPYPFAFVQVDSGFEALTGFKKEGDLMVFTLRIVKGCESVLKYIVWFILDTLLK